jgi:hypothetical protein
MLKDLNKLFMGLIDLVKDLVEEKLSFEIYFGLISQRSED